MIILPVVLCTLLGAPAPAAAAARQRPAHAVVAADATVPVTPAADPEPPAEGPGTPEAGGSRPGGAGEQPGPGGDAPSASGAGGDTPPAPGPGGSPAPPAPSHDGPEPPTAVAVARLYEEAARATEQYERGRRAADKQRAAANRLQARLTVQRDRLGALHDALGGVAREQYRTGGSLARAARLLLVDDPDTLFRSYHAAAQAERALNRLLDDTRRAERRIAGDEKKARKAWRSLAVREARLAAVRRGIETKLETAQWRLQGEADSSVAAGSCRGAVRLEQPPLPENGPDWVAPVERYRLSAGFDSTGERWAHRHTGQDFAVGIGAPVRSVGAGRVASVRCGGGFGIEIVVQHPGGYYSQYAHLAGVTVDQGERVRPGQWIGQAGTTGNSTGPHLHFEVRLTPHLGSGVDPGPWLRARGVPL
ncbi:M23 family metallopeptidase [Streptomyces sp. NPDC005805]|uniref:murein hydrolase activator EnvC family protein n=1 Tax=Streptomyces sp. NPDC005805 TaxID=3157068 RepID=UPI00340CF1A2